MLSEAVSTERAVSSLKEVYQQACSQVESEVAEPEKHQLQLLGHRLCDSVDDAKISRIRRLYAEFSADPRNAGLQGGCGEMWTFRDGGDLDISFPMQLAPRTHESQVKLRDRGENGEFQLAIEPNGNESELWYLRTLWSWRKSYSLQLDIVYASLLVFFHILFISNGDWKRWITSAIVIPNDSVISAMLSRMKTSAISIPQWLDGIPALPILRGISLFTRILSPVTLLSRIPGVRNLVVKLNPSESHGPADTDDDIRQRYGSIKTKGVDIVSFVPAPPDVDQLLVEWRCRHQRRFVNSQHFDRLVPACGDLGMVMFDTMHQLWRLSLTEFECQWIRNLPKEQGLVLSVAKLLAKDSQLTDGHPVTNYPIKMSFFWFVYFSADSDWTPQRVCLNALKVLRFLEICFDKKSLPNYFYLDENVLWKYKKDATILAKIPATTKAVGHFLKNNLLEEKQVQNKIHGIEKLLDVFCSGKLEAWNPWRTGNFLATRIYNLESSQETRVGLAAVTHVCLIVLVQVLIVPVALVTIRCCGPAAATSGVSIQLHRSGPVEVNETAISCLLNETGLRSSIRCAARCRAIKTCSAISVNSISGLCQLLLLGGFGSSCWSRVRRLFGATPRDLVWKATDFDLRLFDSMPLPEHFEASFINVSTGRLGAIQFFTVPRTACYFIEARGASGGACGIQSSKSYPGGKGARINGSFLLDIAAELSVVVGQAGTQASLMDNDAGGGGGGGTFVYQTADRVLLLAAGGGGGGSDHAVGTDGQSGTSGSDTVSRTFINNALLDHGGANGRPGFTNVSGTPANYKHGGPGAGWLGKAPMARRDTRCGEQGGGIDDIWAGGLAGTGGGDGGFGGGGGASDQEGPGGGGGGYSGGASGVREDTAGGGGGSYCSGPGCRGAIGGSSGQHGSVTITLTGRTCS